MKGEFGIYFYISHLFLILGEGYRLGDGSMTNPKDTCYKCPNGTYNRDKIDTAKLDNIQLDVCAPIDCSCGHGRLCPSLTLLCQIILRWYGTFVDIKSGLKYIIIIKYFTGLEFYNLTIFTINMF